MYVSLQDAYLYIGLTHHDPAVADSVQQMSGKWFIGTHSGEFWQDGRQYGRCAGWREMLGKATMHYLKEGDTVSVTLHQDRSVSVTLNKKQVKNVFNNLPDRDWWAMVYQWVPTLSIVQQGLYGIIAQMPSSFN